MPQDGGVLSRGCKCDKTEGEDVKGVQFPQDRRRGCREDVLVPTRPKRRGVKEELQTRETVDRRAYRKAQLNTSMT